MESLDRVAYKVLKDNYTLLSTDLDARRITTDAAKAGLLTTEEKAAVWHCAGRDGVSAGVERLLDLLMSKNQEGVFQDFVHILQNHSDLKFWADCLQDEYEAAKFKLWEERQKNGEMRGSRPVLRRSVDPVAMETPPNVRRKMSELSLLKSFKEAKEESRDEVLNILSSYQGDLHSVREVSTNRSLLHVACEVMDFLVVKKLVEQYEFDVNETDAENNTALHIACENKMVQSVIYLIGIPSCDPNVRNSDGLTPLHIAARRGPGIIIAHLLTLPSLDRTVKDRDGRDAISIIRSDPNLASSLDRKVSTASVTSGRGASQDRKVSAASLASSGRKTSEDREVKRKTSAQSNLESYRRSGRPDEAVSLLQETSHEDEEDSKEQVPSTKETANGMELHELNNGNGISMEEAEAVVFREKSQMSELGLVEEVGTSCCSSCYCCCRHTGHYQIKKKEDRCTLDDFLHCCQWWRISCFLLLGIFIGLLVFGALVYFLITGSSN